MLSNIRIEGGKTRHNSACLSLAHAQHRGRWASLTRQIRAKFFVTGPATAVRFLILLPVLSGTWKRRGAYEKQILISGIFRLLPPQQNTAPNVVCTKVDEEWGIIWHSDMMGFFSPAGWRSAKFPLVHEGISAASSCTSVPSTAVGVSWWDCCPNRKPPNGFVHGLQSCLCSHAYNGLLNVPEACGSQWYLEALLLCIQGSQ